MHNNLVKNSAKKLNRESQELASQLENEINQLLFAKE
jgi:hypothetical protein